MAREISPERKIAFYVGLLMMVVGGLLFASVFVSLVSRMDDPATARNAPTDLFLRALGGMALLLVGQLIRRLGARGLAGAGVVLDPEVARRDLEPYSRMAGRMVKDALEDADVRLGGAPERVVMVKCTACGRLKEDDSKYCQECGRRL